LKLKHRSCAYDIIGFEAEHSLVDFKKTLPRLVVSVYLAALHEQWPEKYPAQILKINRKQMDKFDSKGCFIWDIDKGFVLTLDSNKCVESCWSGWASLSAAQIRQIYGDPPTFQKF
jgi:hypothetical protein